MSSPRLEKKEALQAPIHAIDSTGSAADTNPFAKPFTPVQTTSDKRDEKKLGHDLLADEDQDPSNNKALEKELQELGNEKDETLALIDKQKLIHTELKKLEKFRKKAKNQHLQSKSTDDEKLHDVIANLYSGFIKADYFTLNESQKNIFLDDIMAANKAFACAFAYKECNDKTAAEATQANIALGTSVSELVTRAESNNSPWRTALLVAGGVLGGLVLTAGVVACLAGCAPLVIAGIFLGAAIIETGVAAAALYQVKSTFFGQSVENHRMMKSAASVLEDLPEPRKTGCFGN